MTRYIIKATYLEGRHKGKEYYLIKGGYIVDKNSHILESETYDLPRCKATCKRYETTNKQNVKIEKQNREWKLSQGKKLVYSEPIHVLMKYEPYTIN